MKAIDLFCGVGGLSLGLEFAGFKTILGVEKNKNIAEGFQCNFPESHCLIGDISKLQSREYKAFLDGERIGLIAGGPPCQGFSQKGKRLSLDDDRNFLFQYFLKLVEEVQPRAFLIENVPNILSSSKGYFYNEIQEFFDALDYSLSAKVLNAADYGVPQNRKRAFIVGLKGSKPFVFPEAHESKVNVHDALSDLPKLNSGEGCEQSEYTMEPANSYQKYLRKDTFGIFNHRATNHSHVALQRLAMIPENGGRHDLPDEHLTKSIYSGTWTRLRANEQAATITTRFDTPSSGQFTLPTQDRCLTVREAARLQSFPDKFIFTGTKSNQMLQVGNAVPPLLAKEVGSELLKQLSMNCGDGVNLTAA